MKRKAIPSFYPPTAASSSSSSCPSSTTTPPLLLSSLPTPSFLIHLPTVKQNCTNMLNRALTHSIKLRPHVKTHKTLEIGRMQLGKGMENEASERFEGVCTGIVTSTLAEVKHFAAGGFENILYGVPLCVSKIGEVMKAQEKYASTKLHVLLDCPQALSLLLEALRERRTKAHDREKGGGEDQEASHQPSHGVGAYLELGVFIKIDCGYHRAGMDPHDLDEIHAMVQTVTEAGGGGKGLLSFSGIYSHSGHSYGAKREDEEQIYKIAYEEATVMARVYKHLEKTFEACRRQSYPPVVSIGATPTCSVIPSTHTHIHTLTNPTTYKARFLSLLLHQEEENNVQRNTPWEIHPGNYTLYDTMQEEIGACQQRDIAGSVLARVISTYTHTHTDRQRCLIDVGGAALSKEKGGGGRAWGEIVWGKGKEEGGKGLVIKSVSQECAVVVGNDKEEGEEGGGEGENKETERGREWPALGETLRVLPVHSCMAAMCHPRFYVWEEDAEGREVVVGQYRPCKYWL